MFCRFKVRDDLNLMAPNNGSTHKQNRLNHRDMSLYGSHPDQDVFSVVTCYSCGMVLKPQALNEHLQNRHSFNELSEEIMIFQKNAAANEEAMIQQASKRRRLDHNQNYESLPLSPSKLLTQTQNFFMENSPNPPLILANKQQSSPEALCIKMKLKKTDRGLWSVVTAWNWFRYQISA